MFNLLGFPVHVRTGFVMFIGLIVVLYGDEFGLWLAGSLAVFTLLHELGHALAARQAGADAEISLSFFAGYASYSPTRPISRARHAWISFAGPGSQIVVSCAVLAAMGSNPLDPGSLSTDDAALILLRYANGARGSVVVSQVSAGRKNSLQWEIDGSTSAAWWDSETPDHLYIGHRGRPNEILQRGAELMNATGTAAAALPGGHVEGFGDTFLALFRAFYGAILAGRPPERPVYATFADGHHEMVVGDAIARSAAEGVWVDVASTTDERSPS